MKALGRPREDTGLSLPEVLIASFILAFVILSSVRMTTNALSGMSRSKSRSLIDTAIAGHIETLRKESFDFLCSQGCSDDELTEALEYDLITLKPLCKNKDLGEAFLNNLPETYKPESFSVNSIPPVTVTVNYEHELNRVNITFTANINPAMVVSTTLVPHAQGWCP